MQAKLCNAVYFRLSCDKYYSSHVGSKYPTIVLVLTVLQPPCFIFHSQHLPSDFTMKHTIRPYFFSSIYLLYLLTIFIIKHENNLFSSVNYTEEKSST